MPEPSVAARKQQLRQVLRRRRLAIGKARRRHCARRAAAKLLRRRLLRRARHIAVYISVRSELSTGILIELLLRRRSRLWVPVIRSGMSRMHFVPLRRGARLRRGPLGLMQPAGRRPCRAPRRMDLMVLPVLGFDAQGRRLGNGGGYYDRALAAPRSVRRPLLLGYAYAVQELAEIPAEPWDVKLDAVVTEQGLRRLP